MDFFNNKSQLLDLVPDALREPFEKTFVEPLKRSRREKQIVEQKRMADELKELRAKVATLDSQRHAAQSDLRKAEQRMLAAQAEVKAARSEDDRIRFGVIDLNSQIRSLEGNLLQHCSPLLTEFIREMTNELHKLGAEVRCEDRGLWKHNVSGELKHSYFTNSGAVEKTIHSIQRAIREAQEMKSEPLNDDEINVRLDKLRRLIPPPIGWTKIELNPRVVERESYERYSDPIERGANRYV